MEEEYNENKYKDVINSALKDVLQEAIIEHNGEKYLVFIHNIQYDNGNLILDWSTPHEEDKELLYPMVCSMVKLQLGEFKPSLWDRFLSIFKRG